MDRLRLFELPVSLVLLLLVDPAAAQLPYNPTRLLQNGDIVYLFRPAPSATNQAQLLSLDTSSSLDSANLDYTTLYPSLPFSASESAVPYIPVAGADGNLTVYAGDCGNAAEDAKVWKFSVDGDSKYGNGTWTDEDVSVGQDGTMLSPNFLGSGTSFSSSVDGANASLYTFGGMCPYGDATQDNWQSSANYSNAMLQLVPDTPTQYLLHVAPTRGPPVSEAGFALVGLPPTYSNNSDGSREQQQNFVLVGGHTQSAYINMSQVALYSLPQETWTFISVEQPSQGHTDLAIRDQATQVEPRSGHTAVLSPDGTSIIIFGGWVGDVNTPADPQLAVLNIGEGYGGEGAWSWSIPSTSGSGLTDGAGIYGHGATMLSGGVMMIVGGYSITSSSARFKSRADLTQNTQNYFFNVSSNSWLSTYSPGSPSTASSSASGNFSSTSSKAGLGAGLGIGLAAVLSMTIFYFWYKRYLRKKREFREKEIRELALRAHHHRRMDPYENGNFYDGEFLSDREAAALAVDPWFINGRQGWKGHRAHEVESTGLLVEVPSPTRGLRRSLHGRAYHQAPRYDDGRNRGSSNIHPIDEEDEIESNVNERTGMSEMSERPSTAENRISILSTASAAPLLDPFTDPNPLRSHPVLPRQNTVHFPTSLGGSSSKLPIIHQSPSSPVQARNAEVRTGSPNWELVHNANSNSSRSGRSSPDKSDRTESNLSDRSARSALSSLSALSAAASIARTVSSASVAILATITNPFGTPDHSPTYERQPLSLTIPADMQQVARRSGETVNINGEAKADTDSFTTARTSFAKLQAEGEALLGGRPDDVRDIPGHTYSFQSTSASSTRDPPEDSTNAPTHSQGQQQAEDQGQAIPNDPTQQKLVSGHRLPHAASSDTLDLSTPIDNSFATRDRSKSWIGSVRLALTRRPSSSYHSRDRAQSLTSGHYKQSRRYTTDEDGSGLFGTGGEVEVNQSESASPNKLKRGHRRSRSGFGSADTRNSGPASSAGGGGSGSKSVNPSPPRRANSDASFWRSKRGSKAWSEDASSTLPPSPIWPHDVRNEADWATGTPGPGPGHSRESLGAGAEGEEWDVEAAVENRVVQVLFTVPRQRLRVVNADEAEKEDEKAEKLEEGFMIVEKEREKDDKGKQRASPVAVAVAVAGDEKSPPLPSPLLRTQEKKGKGKAKAKDARKSPPPALLTQPSSLGDDDSPTLALAILPPPPTVLPSSHPNQSTSTINSTATAPESPVRGRSTEFGEKKSGLLTPDRGVSGIGGRHRDREAHSPASSVKDRIKAFEARANS